MSDETLTGHGSDRVNEGDGSDRVNEGDRSDRANDVGQQHLNEFEAYEKADRLRTERVLHRVRRLVPPFIEISTRDLRNWRKVLAASMLLVIAVGAPALALHRSPLPAASLRRTALQCAAPNDATTSALVELNRFRKSISLPAKPSDLNSLRTLLNRALADSTHPSIWRHKSTLNQLRLQCGWAATPREVHESIVLQLSALGVPLDYDTAGPIHALASQIAASPSAIAVVTENDRVRLRLVFDWLSTVGNTTSEGKALAPERAYLTQLQASLESAGKLKT